VPAVVQTTWAEPTRNLSKHGRALWDRVMSEYDIHESGRVEMLMQACEAQDRIAKVRQEIDEDGEVIRARGQVKEHPALKIELSLRSFVLRTLARLGLNFEPIRSTAGRPGLSVQFANCKLSAQEHSSLVAIDRDNSAKRSDETGKTSFCQNLISVTGFTSDRTGAICRSFRTHKHYASRFFMISSLRRAASNSLMANLRRDRARRS